MEENNWITHTRKKIYNNPWLEIHKHDVTDPGGQPGLYTTVEFKNRAVGVIPLDEENNTWLVGQYRFPLKEYSWEIPEGGVPYDEDLLEGAKRELKEEVGLEASSYELISEFNTSNSCTNEIAYIYLAKDLKLTTNNLESTEADLKVKKLPFDDVYQMVLDGRIKDSLSIIAILKTKIMLNTSM